MDSKKIKKIQKIALPLIASCAVFGAIALPSVARADTTTPTTPAGVLDPMIAGAQDMDNLAGLSAALGISSSVFGAGALIFKRFVYG